MVLSKIGRWYNPDNVSTKYLAWIVPFGYPGNTSDTVKPLRVKKQARLLIPVDDPRHDETTLTNFLTGDHSVVREIEKATVSTKTVKKRKHCKFRQVAALRKIYKPHQLAALRVRYRTNQLASLREIRRYHKATKYVIHEPRSAGSVPEAPTSD
jgi:hypothetical protein